MANKYPLASTSWDEAEYSAIEKVLKSGQFTMGENVKFCEQKFARILGSRHAVMVNSGSSANLLIAAVLMYRQHRCLKAGDEVIVPAVSWSTTFSPFGMFGLKLVFVDIDSRTLNYDLDKLAAAASRPKAKLIVCVNLLGNPNQFDCVEAIAKENDLEIVEDNCESMGSSFNGKMSGTFGLMGSFSTFFSHHISTMEGGFVVTDDDDLYHRMLAIRAHGWTRDLPYDNPLVTKSDCSFRESFRFILPGFNIRPLELSGAIGLAQLDKLEKIVINRRKNAENFLSMVGDYDWLRPQQEIGKSSWFGFALTICDPERYSRSNILRQLTSAGFEVRPIVAGNFLGQAAVNYFDFEVHSDVANAEELDRHGFFIGNHHYAMDQALLQLKNTLDICK